MSALITGPSGQPGRFSRPAGFMDPVLVVIAGLACITMLPLVQCQLASGAARQRESDRPPASRADQDRRNSDKTADGTPIETVMIPSGSYRRGAPEGKGLPDGSDRRQNIRLTQAFRIQVTEVTRDNWHHVMGPAQSAASSTDCGDCPMESVTWFDAVAYANALSDRDGLERAYHLDQCSNHKGGATGRRCRAATLRGRIGSVSLQGWRLPTEAEWEIAAAADGDRQPPWSGGWGAGAWFEGNARGIRSVGLLSPNAWSLHDMAGNVWEWCHDFHAPYPTGTLTDPSGPETGRFRILRGGSWRSSGRDLVPWRRMAADAGEQRAATGIRLVRTVAGTVQAETITRLSTRPGTP